MPSPAFIAAWREQWRQERLPDPERFHFEQRAMVLCVDEKGQIQALDVATARVVGVCPEAS